MAETISAEEGALKKGADSVQTAKETIDRHTTRVRREIEQLGAYWTGSAAGAFTQLMNRWDGQTNKLNAILLDLESALRGTERDQAETEDAQTQIISGLNSMMSGA